jgi:hypothetical protein
MRCKCGREAEIRIKALWYTGYQAIDRDEVLCSSCWEKARAEYENMSSEWVYSVENL